MDDAGPILNVREVPARRLPTPSTVSPELQQSISLLAAGPGLTGAPTPRTVAEWKAFVVQADAQSLALKPVLEAQFPHTTTRREIAGATVREITPASLDPAKAG